MKTIEVVLLEPADPFEWLEDKGLLVKFMTNVYSSAVGGNFNFFKTSEEYPEALIATAFVWSNTQEGREFWSKVDDQWKEYILVNKVKGLNSVTN